jgi:hypothetical protein
MANVQDESRFSLSECDQIDDGGADWGFTVFADKDIFIAKVGYLCQADTIRGRTAMARALQNAIFIGTSER